MHSLPLCHSIAGSWDAEFSRSPSGRPHAFFDSLTDIRKWFMSWVYFIVRIYNPYDRLFDITLSIADGSHQPGIIGLGDFVAIPPHSHFFSSSFPVLSFKEQSKMLVFFAYLYYNSLHIIFIFHILVHFQNNVKQLFMD